jgi:type II restriction/modification system DNA methylase subunit YeeA
VICKDALFCEWPEADVIVGNPPFLGAKKIRPELGRDYVARLRKRYPEVPGMADYCVWWIRRTHDHLPDCTAENPMRGRAGLVGTQNIRNNKSRTGLDYVCETGTIVEAVDNQPWPGEANVHVSIVNWVKHPAQHRDLKALHVPEKKRLWHEVRSSREAKAAKARERPKGALPMNKQFDCGFRTIVIAQIGPS